MISLNSIYHTIRLFFQKAPLDYKSNLSPKWLGKKCKKFLKDDQALQISDVWIIKMF